MRLSLIFTMTTLAATSAAARPILQPDQVAALSTSAIEAVGTASQKADENSWDSDFGRLSLQLDPDGTVSGNYPQYSGRIAGHVSKEGVISAIWYQPTSEQACSSMQYGTSYWGRVEWKVVDGKFLRGGWAYCDDPMGSGGAWNGGKPSVGKSFASFFSTLIRVAGGVAGSHIGGGIGGNLAHMAVNQATDAAASAMEGDAMAPGAGSPPQDAPAYPSQRKRR